MSKSSRNTSPGDEIRMSPETASSSYFDRKAKFELIRDLELKDPTMVTSVDRLMVLANQFLKAPIAVFSVSEENSLSVVTSHGLPDREIKTEAAEITSEVIKRNSPLIISDMAQKECLAGHRLFN